MTHDSTGLANWQGALGAIEIAHLKTDEQQAPSADETDSDPFAELDELLAESLSAAEERKQVESAKRRLAAGNKQTAEADGALVRSWQSRNVWQDLATVAVFERYKCTTCGTQSTIFRQLMRKQCQRTNASTIRYEATGTAPDTLPREVVVQKWSTSMCTKCCEFDGFSFADGVTEWQGG